jgi:hypothetical protein
MFEAFGLEIHRCDVKAPMKNVCKSSSEIDEFINKLVVNSIIQSKVIILNDYDQKVPLRKTINLVSN